jgi:serine/threonine protein kinase
MVGQGGFSIVCKIENVELNEVFDTSNEDAKARADFAASLRENQYVLKTLRTDLPEEEYVKGIVDLAIESEFLSVLAHPNVISMRAMANSDPCESSFFVILDRLVTTLDRKFNQWRKLVGANTGYWIGPFGYCCAKEQILYTTWLERMAASADIANAIYYLHRKSIIYRDLKPDNLGFDATGTLKLFDFGLSKRLDPMDRTGDSLYMLTGNTGSLRYMAPEVARGENYDQRVDTYSFGILFWQICSLQTPYAGFSTTMHAEKVVRQGYRPSPDPSWPTSWADMMGRAWAGPLSDRPDFDEISVFMDDQLDQLRNNEGEIPSRTAEIKAKKRNKDTASGRLDVDTRISTAEDKTSKRFETNVV